MEGEESLEEGGFGDSSVSWKELRGRKDKCDWSGSKDSHGEKEGRQLLPAPVLG